MRCIQLFALVAFCYLWTSGVVSQESDWNLILHMIEYNTTDENLFKIQLKAARKQPGVYVLNGTVNLRTEIDDKFTIQVKIYRSPNGSGQYSITPYAIEQQVYCDFIKNYYVPMLQKDLKDCTNLPVHGENECEQTIVADDYVFDMCLITNMGMPLHMQPGFYKLVSTIKSEKVETWVTLILEAAAKHFG